MRIVFVPASQSAEDDDKERSKERKAMMADLTAKVVRDTHASALRRLLSPRPRCRAAGCRRATRRR
jgi:hypothetical protein